MNAPDAGWASGVRASDAERERVAKVLESAAAEGRLNPEEAGERLAAASAATYREELHGLIADLPVAREGVGGTAGRAAIGAWGWLWVARLVFVAVLSIGLFTFWGPRFFWPWGLLLLFFVARPWRRRRWRYSAWRRRRMGWETF